MKFMAMTATPLDLFNHAISLMVVCDTEEEIDKCWNALLAGGGKPELCGWLKGRVRTFLASHAKSFGQASEG
jgi:predicted 3-demethylubiquinone-9 3-methyltransferase (glyoxalase superfamily)